MPLELTAAPGLLTPGRRVYAIGDVHGCLAALTRLHGLIAEDLAARPIGKPLLVHLGDYLDRGPDSAGVIERLLTPAALPVADVVNLMGNHEALMLGALDGKADYLATWLRNGGDATLDSWRVGGGVGPDPRQWGSLIPSAHRAMIAALRTSHAVDGYFFAHAGVRPDKPIAKSGPQDLLWIREPFLSWTGRLERVVVHGHTPSDEPTLRPHRIGVDTGAVYGGRLTCAVLEADQVGFLSVPGAGKRKG